LIVAAVPGVDVLVLAADVRDVESVRVAVESVLERFGKLDILIANAGAISPFIPSENRAHIARSLFQFASSVRLKTNSSFHQRAEQKRSECVVEQFRGQHSRAF
jgi:NAD(P)-dependent dehydrogenase (short-subunit alcohol dehydrogenase family)